MVNEQFIRCVPPCPPTPGDGHELCVICLGAEHGCSALEGMELSVRKLHSSLHPMQLWEAQMELAEDLEGVSPHFLCLLCGS